MRHGPARVFSSNRHNVSTVGFRSRIFKQPVAIGQVRSYRAVPVTTETSTVEQEEHASRRDLLKTGLAASAAAGTAGALHSWVPSPRYPDPAVEILDPSFAKYRLFSASVERLATGFRWMEGPVWVGDGHYLLVSDVANNMIVRWDEATGQATTFRANANYANGNTRDLQGRLLTCEGAVTRRISRTEHSGKIVTLADNYEGKPFNLPNDIVCRSDGSICFTDPPFHLTNNDEGRIVKAGAAACGLSNRREEARHRRRPCAAAPASGVAGANPASLDGVTVFNPQGNPICHVRLPERCPNLCFGGVDSNRVFMASCHSVALYVSTRGAEIR